MILPMGNRQKKYIQHPLQHAIERQESELFQKKNVFSVQNSQSGTGRYGEKREKKRRRLTIWDREIKIFVE